MSFAVILYFVLIGHSSAQDLCEQNLECGNSLIVGFEEKDTYNDCLDACKTNPNCNFFTYNTYDLFCNEFYNCLNITTSCQTCYLSEKNCPPISVCNLEGECIGRYILDREVDSLEACQQLCVEQLLPRCGFSTYNPDTQACLLTENCLQVDTSVCPDCIANSRTCSSTTTSGMILNSIKEALD